MALMLFLLYYVNNNTFRLTIDNKQINNYASDLIVTDNNVQYISLKDFASLVGYKYHNGEYKEYSQDSSKAYVDSMYETASFFLNSNKICKVPPTSGVQEEYEVFTVNDNVKEFNNKLYASIDAVKIGFNVSIEYTEKKMTVKTLDSLVTAWTADTKEKGYELSTEFKNQKGILYEYIIARNESKGLYGVYDSKYNELITPRYSKIEFIENSKEFLVTTSDNKVGIIDAQGKERIKQIFDSIKLIDKDDELYLVSYDQKFGVINKIGQYIIYPEYEKIGIDSEKYKKNISNNYILLENFIPVNKNGKWGAFDKTGKMLLSNIYTEFGCQTINPEIGGEPVIEIEEVGGIVVRNGESYGIYSKEGKELIPIALKNVYGITSEGKTTYYMTYNNNQMNVVDYINKN